MGSRFLPPLFVGLGAALLFAMEPLVGRLLLPSFGSAFHVWSTSLMFFQGGLFLGYLYAHFVAPRLGGWHLLTLLLPLPFLPFAPPASPAEPDVASLLGAMSMHFGVPFVVLSTTSVVAQQWWTRSRTVDDEERASPWRLYAASNAGSLLALVVYVFVWEPFSGLATQGWMWTALYVVWLGVAFACWRGLAPSPASQTSIGARPTGRRLAFWVLVAAWPSALSLGVTNVFVLDVGNAPLVWILPLVVYLLTFVLVFGRARWYPTWMRRLWPHVSLVGLVAFFRIAGVESWLPLVHLVVLFVVATAAHGELYESRPEPEQLTWFYLAMALGGWLGSALVALLAPELFSSLLEYPLAIVALLVTLGVAKRAWKAPRGSVIGFAVIALAAGVAIGMPQGDEVGRALAKRRSPYGVYRVVDVVERGHRMRRLDSGRTVHGRQAMLGAADDVHLSREPLGYYHRESPLGDVLRTLPRPRRLGVVGLGVGAIAGHLEAGEHVSFHEIDPVVVELAERFFTYLDGEGEVRLVTGDARHTLAAERREEIAPYDALVVDAFSGDAVPLHLLTVEALDLYRARVGDEGLVVYHVSNRYLDLRPPLRGAAEARGLEAWVKDRGRDLGVLEDASRYVAIGSPERVRALESFGWRRIEVPPRLFTDDHASVLPLWRF
ncbi:MAG: fused MFS/spermidine synthase [Sandaracinus sp.]|nr:fused MFS/spermidine synthase [Sandaracinus sp.]MCB9620362.1 fused MFS/spermidine synthase [Sandaracinus sp.]